MMQKWKRYSIGIKFFKLLILSSEYIEWVYMYRLERTSLEKVIFISGTSVSSSKLLNLIIYSKEEIWKRIFGKNIYVPVDSLFALFAINKWSRHL